MGYPNQQFKTSLCVTGIKEDESTQHGSENDDPNQGEVQQEEEEEEEDCEIVEMEKYDGASFSDNFFTTNWAIFSKCKVCWFYSYVAQHSPMRSKQCRGCMRKECSQFRGLKKAEALLEKLFKVHGISATNGM